MPTISETTCWQQSDTRELLVKYLAACVHVKNEEDIIQEWMAFHRSVGVEHLIIIDNGSSDRTPEIVKAFPDPESVSYLFLPEGNPTTFATIALKTFGEAFEWMAFIDADEFLYPSQGNDLRQVISEFDDCAGIGVYWQIYGSSGHLEKPEGLVIDTMINRAESTYLSNRHVKSIVKPRKVFYPLGSHMFMLDGRFVDEQKRDLHMNPPYGFFEGMTPSHDLIRINHYHVRSRAQYVQKSQRGYFGLEDDKLSQADARFNEMWTVHDKNDISDDSACRFMPLMNFYYDGKMPASGRKTSS
jgi:glycosyltransferase involved in cell wall biosynthesis